MSTGGLKASKYKLLALLMVACVIFLIWQIYFSTARLQYNLNTSQIKLEFQLPHDELLNLTDFYYILPNNLCQKYNDSFLGIIIVTSYAAHAAQRSLHREAISQFKLAELGFQRIFLIAAIPPSDFTISQRQLLEEQQYFGDLLQGNFYDSYHNLSYKHIMGLRWASTNCSSAKFILKVDDDIVFDIFKVKQYLNELVLHQTELVHSADFMAGIVFGSGRPIRDAPSKWFVSKQYYAADIYPPYLSGWFYIINSLTAQRLVDQAQRKRFSIFWIDDVWVTGILRAPLNISMQSLNSWLTYKGKYFDCCTRDIIQYNYTCEYFIGPNDGDDKSRLANFLYHVERCYTTDNGCVERSHENTLEQTCIV